MDIRKYIKELLFLHDCVIIPGFGGFVANYQSSEIQRFKNVIYPPSKSLMFNRKLQTNDGVLVNHIAGQENMDYKAAVEMVRQSAEAWNRLIDNRGVLLLPDIGKLYINSSNAMVFLPELRKNYLTETFGLKPIAYQSDIRSKPIKIIEMKRTPEPIEDEDGSEKQTAKSNTGKWVAAIAAILVLLLLIPQMFMQNMLPENLRIQQLNVMQFLSPDSSDSGRQEIKVSGENTSSAEGTEQPAGEADTTAELSETPVSTDNETTTASAGDAASEETPTAESAELLPATGNFYIMFGESDFISDAVRLKKQLDEEYGKTFEVFPVESGNYVVGLQAGESQAQAEASLGYFSDKSNLRIITKE